MTSLHESSNPSSLPEQPSLTRASGYKEFDAERGDRISAAMAQQGFSYNCQLCYEIGISESTLSRWRTGRPISLRHAVKLCDVLRIDLDYLLLGTAPYKQDITFSSNVAKFHRYYRSMSLRNRLNCLHIMRRLAGKSELTEERMQRFLPSFPSYDHEDSASANVTRSWNSHSSNVQL